MSEIRTVVHPIMPFIPMTPVMKAMNVATPQNTILNPGIFDTFEYPPSPVIHNISMELLTRPPTQ